MRRARRAICVLAAALVLMAGASACGSEESPADAVPEIGSRLDRVDAAIEGGNYSRARAAVQALVAVTAQARVDGDLSDEQADRILLAASGLLSRLPEEGSDELPAPDDGLPTDLADPDVETDEPELPPEDEGEGNGEGNGGSDEGAGHDEEKDKDDKDKGEDKAGKSEDEDG